MKIRNHFVVMVATIATASVWSLFSRPASAQVTVFNDNFNNGSTVNQTSTPGGTPTASSTSYDILSAKATTTAADNPNDLMVQLPSTSSSYLEAQAVFTSTPVTLATVGDYIDFTMTFTNTSNILNVNDTGSQFWVGLYNSGGSAPLTTLMTGNGGTNAPGGSSGWLGFLDQIAISTASSKFYVHSNETGSSDQLVMSTHGNQIGSSYPSPNGFGFNNGSLYTENFTIYLSAPGQLTVSNAIYNGGSVAGTPIFNQSPANVTSSNLLTSSFDSLAFGWEAKGGGVVNQLDVSDITISDSIAVVPEPSSILLLLTGLGALLMAIRRHRRH